MGKKRRSLWDIVAANAPLPPENTTDGKPFEATITDITQEFLDSGRNAVILPGHPKAGAPSAKSSTKPKKPAKE